MSTDIIQKLNDGIALGFEANQLKGFAKAYKLAEASKQLNELLTNDYIEPIMKLQGNKLGFKTDKDDKGGYPIQVVKNCLIEAVLTGVQPVNNQFNIIAGNCYITKEGFGYLLKNTSKLVYEIIPKLPRINDSKTSAAIVMIIKWEVEQDKQEREIEFPIRMNQYMGIDAVIGKATRKARAWLYNRITDNEIADGDVHDIPYEDVSNKKEVRIDVTNAKSKTLFENGTKK